MIQPAPHDDTLCVQHPAPPLDGYRSFSVPVFRASTIVFDDAESYRTRADRSPDGYVYGLSGTPTTRTLELQLSALHGAVRSIVVPSGQAAITSVMLALLKAGDHVLIADNCYPPVREFAKEVLARCGIRVDWFDPTDLVGLEGLIRTGETRLIWMESPGSTTMEVCDIPAIASLARRRGVLTGCDNTWASGLFCKPLELGVDVVAEALTKYAGGHSDILLGALSFRDLHLYGLVRRTLSSLGVGVSPDDCWLALRGLETMPLRLRHAGAIAQEFATRLCGVPGVAAVFHPGLPDAVGHRIWQRDFSGSAGVFTVLPVPSADSVIDRALDTLRTFSIGASWGGTRSLVAPMTLATAREVMPVDGQATYLRVSIGLEAPDALWRDLEVMCRTIAAG